MNNSGLSTVQPFTDLRWYYSAFLQDSWKVSPRFTLNLGVRWEYAQPIRELKNLQSNFVGVYNELQRGHWHAAHPFFAAQLPIPTSGSTVLGANNIAVRYSDNDCLVNPMRIHFAPRFGFSYATEPRTVLRGGFDMFYGGLENIGLGLNLANNAPFFTSANFIPTPQCVPQHPWHGHLPHK